MGKGRIFGSVAAFALVCAAATWNGCGSSNDQGISFRALGFFSDSTLTTPVSQECDPFRDTTIIPANGADLFLGLQNNMTVGVNLNRIDLSYHINGATLVIPNDVFAVSTRLGPGNGSEASPPTVGVPVVLVSPQIMQFLNDNSSRLPDLPFTMIVFATAVGTSDAGDEFEANRVSYQVIFAAQSGGCGAVATPGLPTPTPGQSLAG